MIDIFATTHTYFGVNVSVDSLAAIGPGVMAVVFAILSFISTLRQRSLRGLLILIALPVVLVGFEAAALWLDIYGKASYSQDLGQKLFGLVPWALALIYPAILLAAFWLARKLHTGWLTTLATTIFVLVIDVVLQPAAVALGFLKWEHPGPLMGIAPQAIGGWFVANFIAAWLLKKLWGQAPARRGVAYSGFAILAFWTGVNLGIKLWLPAAVGAALTLVFLTLIFLEKHQQKQEK